MEIIKNAAEPRVLLYQRAGGAVLAGYLRGVGFSVTEVGRDAAPAQVEAGGFDLYLLDHYTPAGNGPAPLMLLDGPEDLLLLDILRRTQDSAPCILLSDRGQYAAMADAYAMGVDEYVVRPCNYALLVWKMRAALRRYRGDRDDFKPIRRAYQIGEFRFDTAERVLVSDSRIESLSETAAAVLALLCAYYGEVVQKDFLITRVGFAQSNHKTASLLSDISALRAILRPDKSVRISSIASRAGYILEADKGCFRPLF